MEIQEIIKYDTTNDPCISVESFSQELRILIETTKYIMQVK